MRRGAHRPAVRRPAGSTGRAGSGSPRADRADPTSPTTRRRAAQRRSAGRRAAPRRAARHGSPGHRSSARRRAPAARSPDAPASTPTRPRSRCRRGCADLAWPPKSTTVPSARRTPSRRRCVPAAARRTDAEPAPCTARMPEVGAEAGAEHGDEADARERVAASGRAAVGVHRLLLGVTAETHGAARFPDAARSLDLNRE